MSPLDQLKRTAWRMKKERRIKHSEALDLAARMAGFPSYTQARKAYADQTRGQPPQ